MSKIQIKINRERFAARGSRHALLLHNYEAIRRERPAATAANALMRARKDVTAGKNWPSYSRPTFDACDGGYVAITRPQDLGIVFVGMSSACRRDNFGGWYSDHYGSECLHGAVFAIRRQGEWLTFAGAVPTGWAERQNFSDVAYIDLKSPDRHSSVDCFDPLYERLRWGGLYCEAARGDALAEKLANRQRGADTAFQAGRQYRALQEDVRGMRKEAREVAQASRDNVTGNEVICAVLRERVKGLREQIRQAIKQCRSLADGDEEDYYFYSGDKCLTASFKEGAASS